MAERGHIREERRGPSRSRDGVGREATEVQGKALEIRAQKSAMGEMVCRRRSLRGVPARGRARDMAPRHKDKGPVLARWAGLYGHAPDSPQSAKVGGHRNSTRHATGRYRGRLLQMVRVGRNRRRRLGGEEARGHGAQSLWEAYKRAHIEHTVRELSRVFIGKRVHVLQAVEARTRRVDEAVQVSTPEDDSRACEEAVRSGR